MFLAEPPLRGRRPHAADHRLSLRDLPQDVRALLDICTAEAGDYYTIDTALSQHAGYHISEQWLLPPRGR